MTRVTCTLCNGQGTIDIETAEGAMEHGQRIILQEAASRCLDVKAMLSPSRRHDLAAGRRAAAVRMRTETNLHFKQIGLLLGRRDHSTVINMVRPKRQGRNGAKPSALATPSHAE